MIYWLLMMPKLLSNNKIKIVYKQPLYVFSQAIGLKFFPIVSVLITLQSCDLFVKPKLASFSTTPEKHPIENGIIDEASGMAASRTLPNHVWIHEDGGNAAAIHLLTNRGEYKGKLSLNIVNRDWEDMAIGPGPSLGKNYLYIADTGDNLQQYDDYAIYRLEEPTSLTTMPAIDKIAFRYPDGKYDAETLLLDPLTKDIYIVTKQLSGLAKERLYRLSYPQSVSETITAEFIETITTWLPTSGEISADGSEILLKTYDAIYYWKRKTGETVTQTLARSRDVAPAYEMEVQGEAICFDKDANGFFTISERNERNIQIPLYYYRKE